jgi:hypothetical protein
MDPWRQSLVVHARNFAGNYGFKLARGVLFTLTPFVGSSSAEVFAVGAK